MAAGPYPRVDTFIVGAQRCGTTAWFSYLRSHPHVITPRAGIKEPQFFASDLPFPIQLRSIDDYHALYAPDAPGRRLDASTRYLFSPAAARRIQDYNPEAKIIVLLRSPLAFLPSYHALQRAYGQESEPDFERAWDLQQRRQNGLDLPRGCRVPMLLQYRKIALLGEQLERYAAIFPPDRLAVLDFDDWIREPRTAYLALLRFLELDDDGRQRFPAVNEAWATRAPWLDGILRSSSLPSRALRRLLRSQLRNHGPNLLDRLQRWNRKPLGLSALQGRCAERVMAELADDQQRLDRIARPFRLLRRS